MAPEGLLIAKGEKDLFMLPKMANRHGLVAGATGTGKTVSLQVMAESSSRIGVLGSLLGGRKKKRRRR